MINKKQHNLIRIKYLEFEKKFKPKFGFDSGDITSDNFRLSRGKVYFVDIEAVNKTLMGIGFAKAFLKWFKTDSQRKKFLRGYNSVTSSKFLTQDYLNFVYIYFLVANTASKINNKLDYSNKLDKVRSTSPWKITMNSSVDIREEQIQEICKRLNTKFINYTFLSKGDHNINYVIETEKIKYVLRVENNNLFKNLKKEFEFLKNARKGLGRAQQPRVRFHFFSMFMLLFYPKITQNTITHKIFIHIMSQQERRIHSFLPTPVPQLSIILGLLITPPLQAMEYFLLSGSVGQHLI